MMEVLNSNEKKRIDRGGGGGLELGGHMGPTYASEKGLYLKNYWINFEKWICFVIRMNWGFNLV